MILGCDAAGTDRGRQRGRSSTRSSAIRSRAVATRRSTRSARCCPSCYPGTLAEQVVGTGAQRRREAGRAVVGGRGSLSTAWLTAYRMLFTKAQVQPGQTDPRAGRRRRRRDGGDRARPRRRACGSGRPRGREAKRAKAIELGADQAFEPGARLPERVDAVIETVGEATFGHSLKSIRPGGRVVVCGSTSGASRRRWSCSGCSSCRSRCSGRRWAHATEFDALLAFLATTGLRPTIDSTLPLAERARASRSCSPATSSARSCSPPEALAKGGGVSRLRRRSRASQVASRSTGTSNSGFRSTNAVSRSASQASETVSSPRRCSSSSIPRSVKYTALGEGLGEQFLLLDLVLVVRPGSGRRRRRPGDPAQVGADARGAPAG